MSQPNLSVTDCVYLCMRNGRYWTFWELQTAIKKRFGKFYGEPTISAAIRDLRNDAPRQKYGFPNYGEVVTKKRVSEGKGWKYKLLEGVNDGKAI